MLFLPDGGTLLQLLDDIAPRRESFIAMWAGNGDCHRSLSHGDVAYPVFDRETNDGPPFAGLDRHFADLFLDQLRISLVLQVGDALFSIGMIAGGAQKENHRPGGRIPDFGQESRWVQGLGADRDPPVNRCCPHNIDSMNAGSRKDG